MIIANSKIEQEKATFPQRHRNNAMVNWLNTDRHYLFTIDYQEAGSSQFPLPPHIDIHPGPAPHRPTSSFETVTFLHD